MRVAIEAPTSFANSNFHKQARVLSASLKIEKPLFRRSIRIRPKDYFPREGFSARKGVQIQKQRVLTALELDRFTGGRFYNPRSALDMDRIPVDPI
jgi:hypothetical protein